MKSKFKERKANIHRGRRIYCKYCGARLVRDLVGWKCSTHNCQWQYGIPESELRPGLPHPARQDREGGMTCKIRKAGDGYSISCSKNTLHEKCRYCPRKGVVLCDYILPSGKTCDTALCLEHSIRIEGKDYCVYHK